jgi:hypothetical protein
VGKSEQTAEMEHVNEREASWKSFEERNENFRQDVALAVVSSFVLMRVVIARM